MATEEEVYRLIIQVENEEKLKTAAAAASLAEQKFKSMYDQFGAGHAKTKAAAGALADLNGKMKTIGSLSGFNANKMQVFAQTLDDLQYVPEQGLRPILNNLVQLSPVLGAVAVGGQILYQHWEKLAGLWGEHHIKTAAEEMEELRKKTSLTADEAERLARAEALLGKVKELRGARSDEQKAEEAAATHAVAQAGFANVVQGVRDTAPDLIDQEDKARAAKQEKDRLEAHFKELRRRADNPEGDPDVRNRAAWELVGADDKMDAARKKLEEARNTVAEEIIALGTLPAAWAGQRQKIADLAKKNPAAFAGGDAQKGFRFAEAMTEAGRSPEDLAIDAKNRGFDAQAAKNLTARRQKEKEKQDQLMRDRQAAYEKQRDALIQKHSPGMRDAYSPEILNNIARGKPNDLQALIGSMADRLAKGGVDEGTAKDVAPAIARKVLDEVGGQVRGRANEQGLSKEEAAAREAEDAAAAARSRAPVAHGAISDPTQFASTLQMALFSKVDPIQKAILDENRKQAKKLEELVEETRKVRPRGAPVAVAGP